MSYYQPEILDHPPEGETKPVFSIAPLEFVVKELKEPLFIFDLPADLVVCLDNIEIPSHLFDYFNPLLVDPDGLGVSGNSTSSRYGRLLFYRKTQDVPIESFFCFCLIPSQSHLITSVLNSTIHYPSNYDIDYQTLTVSRTLKARQLYELFEKTPIDNPLARLLNSLFQPQVRNSEDEAPSSIFLEPLLIYHEDDSD